MNFQGNEMKINRPAFFDWLVFSISFSLGFIFQGLKDFYFSPSFSNWMLAALLLYTAGAWLKHRPLSYRVTTTGESLREIPYMLFLLCGHWIIIATAIILVGPAVRKIFSLQPLHENEPANGLLILSGVLVSMFITWIVFRPKKENISTKYMLLCIYSAGNLLRIFYW